MEKKVIYRTDCTFNESRPNDVIYGKEPSNGDVIKRLCRHVAF